MPTDPISNAAACHHATSERLGSAEALLVAHLQRPYESSLLALHSGGALVALKGGFEAGGARLPFLPNPIPTKIVSRLDVRGQMSLNRLWVERLSVSGQKALLDHAGKAYGFSRAPVGICWETYLSSAASLAARLMAASSSDIVPSDTCLAGLLLGTLDPADAAKTQSHHRAVVLRALEQDACLLKHASPALRKDPDVVSHAISLNPLALQWASPALQDSACLVRRAIERNGLALEWASPTLQDNPALVLRAVWQNEGAFQYASARLRDHPSMVLAVVPLQYGHGLGHASLRLRDDFETMLKAMKLMGHALEFLSDRLRDNREIVSLAVRKNGNNLRFASAAMTRDPAIVLSSVESWGHLGWASPELRVDRAIVMRAAELGQGWQMEETEGRFADDQELIYKLAQKDGDALKYASSRLRNNADIVRLCVEKKGHKALQLASVRFQQDPLMKRLASETDGRRRRLRGV